MVFALILGGIILLFGMHIIGTVVQFYIGQRRDLYFHPDQTWIGMARIGGALFMIGGGLMVATLLPMPFTTPLVLSTCTLVTVGWWLAAPPILNAFPPRWLSQLERNRAQEDINAIMESGAALLQRYPDTFRRVIRHAEGWESWLMTVTRRVPLATLDGYVQRCQLAIRYNLHPIAIEAANEIIKFRPDQPLGYHLRARAHLGMHHFQDALADLSTCIHLQPHDVDLYYQRARIYHLLNQPDAAGHDIEQAQQLTIRAGSDF